MKEKKLDQLFDAARLADTEVTKESIDKIVAKISMAETKALPETKSLFTIKNLLMLSLFVFIGSLLFIQSDQDISQTELSSEIGSIEFIEEDQIEEVEHEIHFGEYENDPENIASANDTSPELIEVPNIITKIESDLPKQDLHKREKEMIERPIESSTNTVQNSSGSINVVPADNDKIKMSSWEVLRLKRSLYKNLIKDKLIKSKISEVDIYLFERSIVVNGKELDVNQYSKYRNLTRDAGWGEKRMIRMTAKNIRVGDFDGLNFKGVGVGLFFEPSEISKIENQIEQGELDNNRQEEIDEEKRKRSETELRDELAKKEMEALNKFTKDLYKDASGPFRKVSLSEISLKRRK